MEELKPCPCCGREAIIETIIARKGWESVVSCQECLLSMYTITYDTAKESIDAVIKAWNTRA